MQTTQDEELLKRVTAKLVGEFCIGQEVRVVDPEFKDSWQGLQGVVRGIDRFRYAVYSVGVDFGEDSDGEMLWFEPKSLQPV